MVRYDPAPSNVLFTISFQCFFTIVCLREMLRVSDGGSWVIFRFISFAVARVVPLGTPESSSVSLWDDLLRGVGI